MSTRCNIRIVDESGNEVMLYHHHDGYPEGVGKQLDLLMQAGAFGNFPCPEGIANKLIKWNFKFDVLKKNLENKGIDPSELTCEDDGYDVTCCLHGDIEYMYIIKLAYGEFASLECYECDVLYDEVMDKSIMRATERKIRKIYRLGIDGWNEFYGNPVREFVKKKTKVTDEMMDDFDTEACGNDEAIAEQVKWFARQLSMVSNL